MRRARHQVVAYVGATLGVGLAVVLLVALRGSFNPTTIALSLLLVVLFAATFGGSGPALVASIVGMLSFNYFFLPPLGTFTISDPQNWVALAAFFITAITAGELSAHARRRAGGRGWPRPRHLEINRRGARWTDRHAVGSQSRHDVHVHPAGRRLSYFAYTLRRGWKYE